MIKSVFVLERPSTLVYIYMCAMYTCVKFIMCVCIVYLCT